MELPSQGSVTAWLDELKAGRSTAAQALWNRYFTQLVQLARHRLRGRNRDVDEEDVALSAIKSAMLGVQQNRFPDLTDRSELWPLLVTITARKALNELKRQGRQKRSRVSEAALVDVGEAVGREPTPDFALRLAEAINSLVEALGDETLQTVAELKLAGYANDEIAERLAVSPRTVQRKLHRVREEWKALDEGC